MDAPTRAVLLDALGTLVELEPPFERLHAALGGEVAYERVEQAMRAEMAYYRANSHEARDEGSLADLRERCAALLSRELGREVDVATMMSAIRFRAYPDAPGSLADLRGRGLGLVCVSNWDCSLPEVLDRVGLGDALDGVLASATAGSRKPDPAIFEAALELAGVVREEALMVGDSQAEDIAGAAAAGIRAVLVDRSGTLGSDPQVPELRVPVISSLGQIRDHLPK